MAPPASHAPTSPSDHTVLAKVRKILTKAEDPATTPAEAEAYTAKAAELIAAYGVDRALLAERDADSDVVGDKVVLLAPPYALDKAGLLAGVAAALRCRAVQRSRYDTGRKQLSMHLFGFESDLDRAEILYTSLLLQAGTAMQRSVAPPGESVAAYRRSWLAGFTSAVVRRLRDAEQRAGDAAEHPRTCEDRRSLTLVLADRSTQVESALQRTYPHLRRGRARTLAGSGGRAGHRAGQRADLGGTRVRSGSAGQIDR